MIQREFSGKTEDEVVEGALDILKLRKEQVALSVENKSGLFSFGKKRFF